MRKIHIIMFGWQFVLSLVFSLLLFCGILGEYALFAFVYPVLVCIYFVLDVFVTMISTDLLVRAFQNKTACMLSVVARDLVIIGVWVSILLYINILKKSGTGVSLFPTVWRVARSNPHCFWGRVSECQGLLLLRCSFGRHR